MNTQNVKQDITPARAVKRTAITENVVEQIEVAEEEPSDYIYSYSCAMIPLSEQASSVVGYWARVSISPEDLYVNPDQGIDGYEEDPHVTVKYGLHDTDPESVRALIKGCGSVTLKFGAVTRFDTNPAFDVIKIDVISDKLMKLNKIISEGTQNTDKFPTYIPHITLAYVKKGTCSDIIGSTFFDKLIDTLHEMQFASRNGEDYWIDL